MGEAYAIFNCTAGAQIVRNELTDVTSVVHAPSSLELRLGMPSDLRDDQLQKALQKHKVASLRYALYAAMPNQSNWAVARELSAVMNQLYNTPLYKEREPFFGELLYREGNQYVAWDTANAPRD